MNEEVVECQHFLGHGLMSEVFPPMRRMPPIGVQPGDGHSRIPFREAI